MQTEDIDIDNEYLTQHRSENYENATPPILFFGQIRMLPLWLSHFKNLSSFPSIYHHIYSVVYKNWCKDSIYIVAFMNLNQSYAVKNIFVR